MDFPNPNPKQARKYLPKPNMTYPPTLLILLLLAAHGHRAAAKRHVHVMNRLGGGRALTLHCESADDDLGAMVIDDGYETSWSFSLNFWGTTLFHCKVAWRGSGGWLRFDAYDAVRDHQRCSECWWKIDDDGYLYGYEPSFGQWKVYPLTKNVPLA